jgi:hypothetical protein
LSSEFSEGASVGPRLSSIPGFGASLLRDRASLVLEETSSSRSTTLRAKARARRTVMPLSFQAAEVVGEGAGEFQNPVKLRKLFRGLARRLGRDGFDGG